ncbi:hypothetical protein EYF80_033336 [Liparis tanakae]|uniref:Uncharacterized protein n=1 Tax=Liparis tanakae TaxID=230148 RepID=A0A4Z2GSI8_9TELE|nr:hypothetical protein EYF80_033336 [Liparis tanakae]
MSVFGEKRPLSPSRGASLCLLSHRRSFTWKAKQTQLEENTMNKERSFLENNTSSLVMSVSTTSLWYRMSLSAVMASSPGALISVGPKTMPRFSLDMRFSFSYSVTLEGRSACLFPFILASDAQQGPTSCLDEARVGVVGDEGDGQLPEVELEGSGDDVEVLVRGRGNVRLLAVCGATKKTERDEPVGGWRMKDIGFRGEAGGPLASVEGQLDVFDQLAEAGDPTTEVKEFLCGTEPPKANETEGAEEEEEEEEGTED